MSLQVLAHPPGAALRLGRPDSAWRRRSAPLPRRLASTARRPRAVVLCASAEASEPGGRPQLYQREAENRSQCRTTPTLSLAQSRGSQSAIDDCMHGGDQDASAVERTLTCSHLGWEGSINGCAPASAATALTTPKLRSWAAGSTSSTAAAGCCCCCSDSPPPSNPPQIAPSTGTHGTIACSRRGDTTSRENRRDEDRREAPEQGPSTYRAGVREGGRGGDDEQHVALLAALKGHAAGQRVRRGTAQVHLRALAHVRRRHRRGGDALSSAHGATSAALQRRAYLTRRLQQSPTWGTSRQSWRAF
eukprot:scaffold6691_cov358-Prasinococcus_capsulatus_cf.AAC.10